MRLNLEITMPPLIGSRGETRGGGGRVESRGVGFAAASFHARTQDHGESIRPDRECARGSSEGAMGLAARRTPPQGSMERLTVELNGMGNEFDHDWCGVVAGPKRTLAARATMMIKLKWRHGDRRTDERRSTQENKEL